MLKTKGKEKLNSRFEKIKGSTLADLRVGEEGAQEVDCDHLCQEVQRWNS
jgi:hypothetical protein